MTPRFNLLKLEVDWPCRCMQMRVVCASQVTCSYHSFTPMPAFLRRSDTASSFKMLAGVRRVCSCWLTGWSKRRQYPMLTPCVFRCDCWVVHSECQHKVPYLDFVSTWPVYFPASVCVHTDAHVSQTYRLAGRGAGSRCGPSPQVVQVSHVQAI